VEKADPAGPVSGDRKAATLFGSDRELLNVKKFLFIPQPLTPQRQNSFPDVFFIHRSGKAGKRAIQTAIQVVN